jgi:hypothetical protein
MINFKKAIPRRTFLRGAGATLALPLLDSMVPAFASASDDMTAKSPVRLCMIYLPNGRIMSKWTPSAEGAFSELPQTLDPLTPFSKHVVVLSGLSNMAAVSRPGEAMGNHGAASAAYLSGVRGKNGQLGITADQIAAQELGNYTQLASLELAMDTVGLLGGGDTPVNDAYTNTISWRSATTPLPMESNPRAVFERLFGDGETTDPEERLARLKQHRSILDFVSQDINRLLGKIGPGDRNKLSEYLEGIRDVERRIQRAQEQTASTSKTPLMERPTGAQPTYDAHAKLMFDLQVLAFQTDMTRVITFQMSHEKSERAYREIGIDEGHHALSHHQGDPNMMARVEQIDLFQSKLFTHFVEKLHSTPEGDGTLLDHVAILFGSGLSDGNLHKSTDLPLIVVGGAGGSLKGGRHVKYPMDTPMANLHLALLERAGVHVEQFADSTGKLDVLSMA